MAYDPIRRKMVLFGGSATGDLGDTWEFDGTDWSQVTPGTSPPAMHSPELTWNASRRRVQLFGGHGSARFNDLWEFDGVNSALIPTSGVRATLGGRWVFDSPGAEDRFYQAQGRLVGFGRLAPRFSVLGSVEGGTTFDKVASPLDQFLLGHLLDPQGKGDVFKDRQMRVKRI